jgi:hypothetical protein
MKLSITVLCALGAVGCSHDSRPQTAVAAPPPTTRVETAQVSESAPPQPGIPTNPPPVAPPAPQLTPPPDQTPLTLTPASGAGSLRSSASGSASLVSAPTAGSDSTRDKAETARDQESIREIRQLLASDKTLASVAPQLTIVARNGRVWLRGQVSTNEQRASIEKVARSAGNVLNVNNELVVME